MRTIKKTSPARPASAPPQCVRNPTSESPLARNFLTQKIILLTPTRRHRATGLFLALAALLSLPACTPAQHTPAPPSDALTSPKPPPVLFLRRKDRERLLAQRDAATRARQQTASADASPPTSLQRRNGQGETISVEGLFDLPSTRRAQTSPTLDTTALASGLAVPVGVGRDDATIAQLLEFDLATVHDRVGKHVIYTLQVARYGYLDNTRPSPEELQKFRAAAEDAVLQFRADGDEAFFYHGPAGSSVTVGLFTQEEYVVQTRGENGAMIPLPRPYEHPRLTDLRLRYPYNLVNGQTLQVRSKGSSQPVSQPSFVVGIP